MYEYFHVKVAANASPMHARYSIDPEYQNIIDRAAAEGWRYVGFIPKRQRAGGYMETIDLVFERQRPET